MRGSRAAALVGVMILCLCCKHTASASGVNSEWKLVWSQQFPVSLREKVTLSPIGGPEGEKQPNGSKIGVDSLFLGLSSWCFLPV